MEGDLPWAGECTTQHMEGVLKVYKFRFYFLTHLAVHTPFDHKFKHKIQ